MIELAGGSDLLKPQQQILVYDALSRHVDESVVHC